MMFAFSVWGLLAAALGGDSSPYVLPEQGSPEQCLSKSLLQKGKSSQQLQVEGLVGNSSNSSLVKDIIDKVDLCLENRVSGAANDPSKLSLLTKIRYGEIYKVLMRQEIPFSALPSSWPQHSVAEANAIVMTGEEAAVTLVSHEFEEEVELWLHHLNLTNASDLQHLVESVAVYLRMCGGDNDVEELAKHVRELGSLSSWDQSDAETMALLLNIVENQCQLETMNLDILVEETGSHNSNHSCNHALGLATTAVHRARARDALRFEKLPDGSVYASSLDRDGYCSAHWKLVEKKPDHWISKSKELEAFVDCFCVAKRHERDCRRDHAAELKVVHTHVRDIVERLEGALQAVDPISLLNANLSTDTSSKGIALGPCDTPLECEVCLGLMCLTMSTTSRRRRGKTMKSMGRNDDIFEAIGTGLGDASTCMSASCSPCMGLKPGDPITFVLEMGASADGCSSSADFMATFKVYITPQMCMGGPLGEIAGLLDMDCVEFGEVAYYPFLNMITLQINTPPVPRLPVPLVRARTELNLILGELTDAVKKHCNRHPVGSADQWNCLSTFYEARGNNQVTLKVEIGADLFFGEIWVTAAKKTFVIAEDNRDGFCRKHQEHGCNGHDQFFQLLDCDNDGKEIVVAPHLPPYGNQRSKKTKKPHWKHWHAGLTKVEVALRTGNRFGNKVAHLRSLCGSETSAEATDAQNQEIEVLESIYGESIEMLSAKDEKPTLLRVEVPVAVDTGSVQLLIGTPAGQVPAGLVEELPPAVLLIALPPQFPLEPAAPALVLEASHLGDADVESLEQILQEEAGQSTSVFDWICKLQEEIFVTERILLTQDMFREEDPMEVAMKLLQHDRRAKEERRQRENQVCPVCFDELPGSRGIFLSCGHFGCRDCLQQMANIHTSEADVTALRCPVPDCRVCFDGDVLRQLLGPDSKLLQKWEELSFKHYLDTMEDIVYCPRCDLEGDGNRVPCIQDEDHMARCEVCGFVFCGKCRAVYHPGAECASVDDRMEALESRAAGIGPEAAAARAELLTLRHLAKTTKKCPKCNMGIEKSEGCSKVLCGNCKIHFCWRCGQLISGYDHFATSECRLFDDDEIRRWNQRVHQVDKAQARAHEARFLAQFIDPEQLRQQSRECPRCRAPVLREGKNNHLRCYACMTQFCARCFEVLPKGKASEHFNKLRICPQHSDD